MFGSKVTIILFLLVLFLLLLLCNGSHYVERFEPKLDRGRKLCIIYVGGTVGMIKQGDHKSGLESGSDFKQQLEQLTLFKKEKIDYDLKSFDPPLDSANMLPQDWNKIATMIKNNYYSYDAFIVIHGTDTMAYNASALSFIFKDLGKSIIFTGGLLPLTHPRSDAVENITQSIYFANRFNVPEVCICFGGKLMRANRAVKVSGTSFDAFDSPKYPLFANTNATKIVLNKSFIEGKRSGKMSIELIDSDLKIALVYIHPGIDGTLVWNTVKQDIDALVIVSYGVGDVPVTNKTLLRAIGYAVSKGVFVVNCSQMLYGRIDMPAYDTGYELLKLGVVSAGDMTVEATVTKLYYIMRGSPRREQLKGEFLQPLRGERSNDQQFIRRS